MFILRHVHVIDSDIHRRARIAYELSRSNLHVEIYEDIAEFASRSPEVGAVFVADDAGVLHELKAFLESTGSLLPVAAYSAEPSPQTIVGAMLGGALDYLRWPFDSRLLREAVEHLFDEGERRAQEWREGASARSAIGALSTRELEVLELMMSGNSNKHIAASLGISPRTVEIHRGNMMRKLRARSPSDAVRLAMLAGVKPPISPALRAA